MRGLLLVAATVALFAAGCGQFGKPTAGRDLSEAVDRLSAIQDDFAAQDPEAMATEEIPTFLRRLAARYRALADDVGTVVISERSREEQRAWNALYQLASRRADDLSQLANDLTSSPYPELASELTNGFGAFFEESAVAELNASLDGVRRPDG
jgi:hypothetical protein